MTDFTMEWKNVSGIETMESWIECFSRRKPERNGVNTIFHILVLWKKVKFAMKIMDKRRRERERERRGDKLFL